MFCVYIYNNNKYSRKLSGYLPFAWVVDIIAHGQRLCPYFVHTSIHKYYIFRMLRDDPGVLVKTVKLYIAQRKTSYRYPKHGLKGHN